MKVYITRRGLPDFVTDSATVGDALVKLWLTTGEQPRASYRIHHGRRRQGREVSSAVGYWRLGIELRPLLRGVIEETASAEQFRTFCENIIEAGSLLGE